MFKKNDRPLLIARLILFVLFCINVILSLVFGIILAVKVYWAYMFLIFGGWILSWIAWIFGRLILSFFCDVKLIRNRLYHYENENLEVFFIANDKHKKNEPANKNLAEEITFELNQPNNSLISVESSIDKQDEPITMAESGSDNEKIEINNEESYKHKENAISKAAIISLVIGFTLSVIFIAIILLLRFYN